MYAIILAAGKGERAGGDVPKQFQLLNHVPVFMHSVFAFRRAAPQCSIIIVAPSGGEFTDFVIENMDAAKIPFTLVYGGASRFESVLNALRALPQDKRDEIVAVHDGARPLVSTDMIVAGEKAVRQYGQCAVPAIPITDSIRIIYGEGSRRADRSHYRAVQTPQMAPYHRLINAYERAWRVIGNSGQMPFTDDASVYEATFPGEVRLFPGEISNIKITNPKDFSIAEIIMRL